MAWTSNRGLGADDWIVIAQQSDEPASAFNERVRQRARRLCKVGRIDSIDVYAAPRGDVLSSADRRVVIEELGERVAAGGRLTLWSGSDDARGDAELAAILAHFGPILAERQIAMNHQSCEAEAPSGVRHSVPTRPATRCDAELEFDFA